MCNVVKLRLKKPVSRKQAMSWLAKNVQNYPEMKNSDISEDIFHGWRFVRGTDGIVYFANCIDAGICEDEINGVRAAFA